LVDHVLQQTFQHTNMKANPAEAFAKARYLFFMAVPIFTVMACLFYILISGAVAFTPGYHTRTNLYLNVWASGVTLCLAVILLIVVATAPVKNKIVNVLQAIFATLTLVFSFISFICYFITLIEVLVTITWGYNVILTAALIHVFIARALRKDEELKDDEIALTEPTVQSTQPATTSTRERVVITGFAICLWIILVIGTSLLCFSNAVFRAHYSAAYHPQGTIYTLSSGQRMHLVCKGASDITLVLETGQPSVGVTAWRFIFDKLAENTRTCWYDRAGYGHSESSEFVRTGDVIARELHELLHISAEIDPRNGRNKVVIAGQSWGGLLARIFQKMYPQNVAGLVLIDATTEYSTIIDSEIKNITRSAYIDEKRSSIRLLQIMAIADALGSSRLLFSLPAYYWSVYDKEHGGCQAAACYDSAAAADTFNNRFILNAYSELFYWSDTENLLLPKDNSTQPDYPLGDLPIAVITAGSSVNGTCEMGGVDIFLQLGFTSDRKAYCDEWNKNIAITGPKHLETQHAMAILSNNTIWKVYWQSRHMVQWDYPVELAQDILDLVHKAKQ
jgi:pimeloyl-ACP methyl ester carboxylesterase